MSIIVLKELVICLIERREDDEYSLSLILLEITSLNEDGIIPYILKYNPEYCIDEIVLPWINRAISVSNSDSYAIEDLIQVFSIIDISSVWSQMGNNIFSSLSYQVFSKSLFEVMFEGSNNRNEKCQKLKSILNNIFQFGRTEFDRPLLLYNISVCQHVSR
jgi:hypothetical protein